MAGKKLKQVKKKRQVELLGMAHGNRVNEQDKRSSEEKNRTRHQEEQKVEKEKVVTEKQKIEKKYYRTTRSIKVARRKHKETTSIISGGIERQREQRSRGTTKPAKELV